MATGTMQVTRAAAVALLLAFGIKTAKRFNVNRLKKRLESMAEMLEATEAELDEASSELATSIADAVAEGKTVEIIDEDDVPTTPPAAASPAAKDTAKKGDEDDAVLVLAKGSYVLCENPDEGDDPWNGVVQSIDGDTAIVRMVDGSDWEEPIKTLTAMPAPDEAPKAPKATKAPKVAKPKRKTWYETAAEYLCGLKAEVTKETAASAVNAAADKDNLRAAESAVTTAAAILVVAGILKSSNGTIVPA